MVTYAHSFGRFSKVRYLNKNFGQKRLRKYNENIYSTVENFLVAQIAHCRNVRALGRVSYVD